jgi:hypothetical protein
MVAADVGKTIVVKVTAKKTGYTTLTKSSAATSVVVGTLTAAPTPTISGTVKVGSTLTAASGTWGPAPVALSFAWSVGGGAKATTATYKIVAADAGKTILVKVTGKKTGYTTVTKTSAATVAVPAVIGTLAPAPTPTITGTVKVGSTLTATPGTWGPSPVALTYAWSVGGVVKATTATYKIAAADAGKTVVVKVTGTKTGYTTLTKTSAATVPVPATVGTLSPAPTPTITGTVKVGSALTAVPGTWGPAPVTLAYAWTVGGEAKATTAAYKIAAADAGKTIQVKVTGTKSGYTTLTKASAATVAVPATVGTLTPAPTPTITGTVKVGSTLTAVPGIWGPSPVALSYEWLVGGVAKATTATYKIAATDVGKTVVVKVTGTKSGYTTLAKSSAATLAVPAVIGTLTPAPAPTITGTVQVGATLTAVPGTWGPAPVALSYEWSVGGVAKAITATYKIAATDAGKTIQVKVTGTKTGYATLAKTSAATAAVPAVGAPVHVTSNIVTDTTWSLDTATVYVIDESVYVAKGTTLTIPAGLVVKFNSGGQLTVDGAVEIDGTADKPTVFTTVADDSIGGDTNGDGDDTAPVDYLWSGIDVKTGAAFTATHLDARFSSNGISSSNAVKLSVSDSALSGGVLATRSQGSAYAAREIAILRNITMGGAIRVASENVSSAAVPIQVSGNSVSGVNGFAFEISDLQLRPSNLTGNTAANNTTNALGVNGILVEDWSVSTNTIPVVIMDDYFGNWWDLTIAVGKTLTAPAGLVLKFDGDARITVDGSLKVLGTAAAPVVFTSIADDSAGGDTNGDGDDSAPEFGNWSGIAVSAGATVTATHLDARFSSSGISGSNAKELSVTDSAVSGGISATRSEGSARAAQKIAILHNTVTGGPVKASSANVSAAAVPMQVSGNSVSGVDGFAFEISDLQLRPSNFTGNTAADNTTNALGLNGILVENWSMPSDAIPVVFLNYSTGNWWDITVASGKTLTVPAGLVLKFDQDARINVDGSLKILGTTAAPVIFTSIADDSVGGDTNGNGDDSAPAFGNWSGLAVSAAATITATHLDARFSSSGISGSDAAELTVSDSAISGGVSATRSAGAAYAARKITILRNTVTRGPVLVSSRNVSSAAVPTQVSGNSVSGVDGFAFEISDSQLRPSKFTGNTAANNTINALGISGILVENWSMPVNAIPVVVLDYSKGEWWDLSVAAGKTLTVPAGLILKFGFEAQISVDGSLKVLGTAAQPVVFTSLADDTVGGDTNGDGDDTAPGRHDWNGIAVNEGGSVTGSWFVARDAKTILTSGGSVNLSSSTLADSLQCIDAWEGSVVISGRMTGCEAGVVTSGSATIDARNVDWGTPDGPQPFGDSVPITGDVELVPWVGYVETPRAPVTTTKAVLAGCKEYLIIPVRGSGEVPGGLDTIATDPSLYDYFSYSEMTNETFTESGLSGDGTYAYSMRGTGGMIQKILTGQRLLSDAPEYVDDEADGLLDVSKTPAEMDDLIGIYPLIYPAAATELLMTALQTPSNWNPVDMFGLKIRPGNLTTYLSSIDWGVRQLQGYLTDAAVHCPDSKVILLGYSQGAMVIHMALAHIAANNADLLDGRLLTQINAVFLMSDPLRNSADGIVDNGTAAVDGVSPTEGLVETLAQSSGFQSLARHEFGGTLSGLTDPYPDQLLDVTRSYCNGSDLLCAPVAKAFRNPLDSFNDMINRGGAIHTGYSTEELSRWGRENASWVLPAEE